MEKTIKKLWDKKIYIENKIDKYTILCNIYSFRDRDIMNFYDKKLKKSKKDWLNVDHELTRLINNFHKN